MSGFPIIATGPGRPREVFLDFSSSIGGPAARVQVVSDDAERVAAPPTSQERASLVRPKNLDKVDGDLDAYVLKRADRRQCVLMWMRVFTGLLIAAVLVGVIVILFRVNDTMSSATSELKPRVSLLMHTVDEASNQTLAALENVVGSTEDGSFLTSVTVPQLIGMVNSTSRTMARLEALLAHPTIQLALGGGAGNVGNLGVGNLGVG